MKYKKMIQIKDSIVYNWADFNNCVDDIFRQVKPFLYVIDNIYSLSKGGLVFGVALSNKLKIPLLLEKDIKSFGKKTLVVDDLVDDGNVLRDFISTHHIFKTASLVWTGKGTSPDFYSLKVVSGNKILFPWE